MCRKTIGNLSGVFILIGALGSCGSERAASPTTNSSTPSAPSTTSTLAGPTTTTSVPATTSTTSASTTTTGTGTAGFDPPCVESTNARQHFRFDDETTLDRFGPLAAEPALQLTLPLGRSSTASDWLPPAVRQTRIPGGVLVAVDAPSDDLFDGSMLAAIDADGERRWVRCFPELIDGTYVAPAASEPTKALISLTTTYRGNERPLANWRIVSLDSGAPVSGLNELLASQGVSLSDPLDMFPLAMTSDRVVLGPPPETIVDPARDQILSVDLRTWTVEALPPSALSVGLTFFGQHFEFSDSGDLVLLGDNAGRPSVVRAAYRGGQWTEDPAVLATTYELRADFAPSINTGVGWLVGVDALGNEAWRSDVSSTGGEGFKLEASGPVTVVYGCFAAPDPANCPEGSLGGVETATGKVLWQLPGRRYVPAVGDGFALISGPITSQPGGDTEHGTWTLIDTATGEIVDATQQWSDPDAFVQECCADSAIIWVSHDGGVVTAVNRQHVAIWYPRSTNLPMRQVTIP